MPLLSQLNPQYKKISISQSKNHSHVLPFTKKHACEFWKWPNRACDSIWHILTSSVQFSELLETNQLIRYSQMLGSIGLIVSELKGQWHDILCLASIYSEFKYVTIKLIVSPFEYIKPSVKDQNRRIHARQ